MQKKQERCPWCREPIAEDAVVCLGCGFNRRAGRFERTVKERDEQRPRRNWRQRWQDEGAEAFVDREFPIGMIAASVATTIVAELATGDPWNLPLSLFGLLSVVVFMTLWMYAGVTTLELFTHGSFGPWTEVTLKLAGINAIWVALLLILRMIYPVLGILVMIFITPLLVFFLLRWLFSLNLFWTLATLAMIGAVQVAAAILSPF